MITGMKRAWVFTVIALLGAGSAFGAKVRPSSFEPEWTSERTEMLQIVSSEFVARRTVIEPVTFEREGSETVYLSQRNTVSSPLRASRKDRAQIIVCYLNENIIPDVQLGVTLPPGVPETGTTLGLLAGSLVALGLIRRRHAAVVV